ncbi:MAG: hypothetical protein OEV78_00655 [Spirochaetia bacterium]|nr:hypothetical protein [Spirochaetia bacterium]
MTRKYVPIDSVDDIDLNKVSIGNINDRYIDKKGNRFATRFNLRTKKIQIIRIALGEDEARKARGKVVPGLVRKKIPTSDKKLHSTDLSHEDISAPSLSEIDDVMVSDQASDQVSSFKPQSSGKKAPEKRQIPDWIQEMGIQPAESVSPGDMLAVLDENYKLLAERLFGIINNVKNSGVMSDTAEIDDAIDFTNIFDHDIHPKMEEAKKYKNELQKYAERPDHYYTMIERAYRIYLNDLPENEIFEFFKAYFIGSLCIEVLGKTLHFINTVVQKTSHVNIDDLDADKRQFLKYAYATCDFLKTYVKEETAKFLKWMIDEKIF